MPCGVRLGGPGCASCAASANLGLEVNTEYAETCPSLSSDGQYLFFSRYDEGGAVSNIYWISSSVIGDVFEYAP
jgi:hypothetical protein